MSFIDTSSFGLMTSLNHIRKNAKLESKWEQRKQQGFSTDGLTERQKDNVNFINAYKEQQELHPEDKEMQRITNKIYAGSKLTEQEMQYLQKKNPVLYQKMRAVEAEAKQYEEDLKCCKTKDEAQRIKMNKINASVASIRSIESNPNISDADKLAFAQAEQVKMREIEKITVKFIESGSYAALPTDAEKFQTEKELEEAKREELQGADTEKTQESEDVQGNIQETGNRKQETGEVKTATTEEIAEAVEKLVGKNTKPEFKIGDNKRNETEIELSDEFRKIKNSKAKKAYIKAVLDYNVTSGQ
ncbi:MAG: hypothetical protein E7556_06830 [Ruminococcaceae bacterium]|nr:hypothetical protein [Oscillospiraceae bacterium]